jgi:hypothetical protein
LLLLLAPDISFYRWLLSANAVLALLSLLLLLLLLLQPVPGGAC